MLPAHQRVVSFRATKPDPRPITPLGPLPGPLLAELEEISYTLLFPSGSVLFAEGDAARGVFMLSSGRVKVSICSGGGKTLILRLAEPGDVLGLPATLSSGPYEVSATAIGPCRCSFIKRDHFLRFMHAHQEVCLAVADQLRKIYCTACYEIRRIGLSHSAVEKLAELLVTWSPSSGDTTSRIRFPFSHEEVGQMIGSSRETVSRVFAVFRKKRLAELNGATLHIRDRASLEAIAAGDGSLTKLLRDKSNTTAARGEDEVESPDHFHPDGV